MPKRDALNIQETIVVGPNNLRKDYVFLGPLGMVWSLFFYRKIRPLDKALLDCLTRVIPHEDVQILKSQIDEVNCFTFTNYKTKSETMFQKIGFFKIDFRRKRYFPFVDKTVIFATAKFKLKKKTIKVDYVLVENTITFLEFNKSTEEYSNETDIEILEFDLDPSAIDDHGKAITHTAVP